MAASGTRSTRSRPTVRAARLSRSRLFTHGLDRSHFVFVHTTQTTSLPVRVRPAVAVRSCHEYCAHDNDLFDPGRGRRLSRRTCPHHRTSTPMPTPTPTMKVISSENVRECASFPPACSSSSSSDIAKSNCIAMSNVRLRARRTARSLICHEPTNHLFRQSR
jgi:hypothetical protein